MFFDYILQPYITVIVSGMDNNTMKIRLSKLRTRRKFWERDLLLAEKSYNRWKRLYIWMSTSKAKSTRDRKTAVQIIDVLNTYERLNQRWDEADLRFQDAKFRLLDSYRFVRPDVKDAAVETLTSIFDAKHAKVPRIVDRIVSNAHAKSLEMLRQRRVRLDFYQLHRDYRKSTLSGYFPHFRRHVYHFSVSSEAIRAEVIDHCQHASSTTRRRMHRRKGLQRYVEHQIWRLKNGM